jgi:hypothetical protein
MALTYADQATKTLTKATPTVDADGKVIKWEVEVEFSLNDYVSKLSARAEVEATKAPGAFSKAELLALPEVAHLAAVYDSQYESTQVPAPAPAEVRVDDFDIATLG